MSCLQKQTIYHSELNDEQPILNSIQNDCSSSTNEDLDENCLEEESIKFKLRNGLRSHFRNDPKNGTFNNSVVKKLSSSLFDQLIREAKKNPETDFNLVDFEFDSSFFVTKNLKNDESQNKRNDHEQLSDNLIQEPNKKLNRRKNQLELLDDFDEQIEKNHSEPIDKQNSMKEISSLNNRNSSSSSKSSQNDCSLKELRNFKNLKTNQNGLIKSNKTACKFVRKVQANKIEVKPAQRIFIDNNLFKYNNGLINVEDSKSLNQLKSTNRYVVKKQNQKYIFENIDDKSKLETFGSLNRSQINNLNSLKQIYLTKNSQSNSQSTNNNSNILDSLNQELIKNCLFRSTNSSPVFDLYTFQDKISSNLEENDCQTSIVALIQSEQITIWTKLTSQSEWSSNIFKLDNQQVFRCKKIDKETYVCILFLVCSFSLVSLKYCLIDKQTKNVQLVHCETFETLELSNSDLNLIQLCFVNPNFIALSIPRISGDIVDVLIYDNVNFESEFNKSKRIIYMLNNVNNKFSSMNNCFLVSDDLDNVFLAIFNQKLFMCNVTEQNKLPKMISLQKYASLDYLYFDVLYDKGIFYIFAGNMFLNYVRIIALNTDRCLAEKLIKYDIEKALEEDRLNCLQDESEDEKQFTNDFDERTVKLFKRKGDHLLIIKNDNTIVLYNLFTDEIVYQTNLNSKIDQTAIAILNQRTTMLAVLNNQIIIDL